ncbi:hypothetical protein Misp01_63060 [Microtetraspora sp. NBRC 13810]|uniref:hypothetical protein n=1 Tax=Microtetraspora sp. NBRC 13810 TaxID=3030990 RepID=UPI0024A1D4B1|nr:hypothetical protein [Microtetraspora sp. NBRC 13810]GLW11178.1 hypothetical protein Misp01_63060 [Microtetraspora sp. NBRC 13810]
MRRLTRALLGMAAVGATSLALVLPATTAATAATTTAVTAQTSAAVTAQTSAADRLLSSSRWWNGDSRAQTAGRVWNTGDRVYVEGRVQDKNSPTWLCGYTQVRFEEEDGDEKGYWARKCGSDGSNYFRFSRYDVQDVRVRTCYWDTRYDTTRLCGRWDYVYEGDRD